MDETYTTRAVILKRQPFREQDSRVVVFCFNKGRLDLVARGTAKFTSKLSAHIEPITLSDIMVVKGKKLSYVGGSVSRECFKNIKNDLVKIRVVSEVFNLFFEFVKLEKRDSELFALLLEFLYILNDDVDCDSRLLLSFFKFKFLIILGYTPELYKCVTCQTRISLDENKINLSLGGLICKKCNFENNSLEISNEAIKILRLVRDKNFDYLLRVKIDSDLFRELEIVINDFYNYQKG